MLRLWSKPVTLSLSPQGVAIKQAHQVSTMLTQADERFANLDQLMTALPALLSAHQTVLHQQQVNIVLSNAFVRFMVIPWQDNLYQQQDWQALAEHAFRKHYGLIANDWQVKVHLGAYGQSVLAAAVDQTFVQQMTQMAQDFTFSIRQISPLLTPILNQNRYAHERWTMIVEPERLLLLQAKTGQWHHLSMDSPPAGLEAEHAMQMVNRALLQVDEQYHPAKVMTYVSASIQKRWRDDIASIHKLANPVASSQAHPAWMAGVL